MADASTDLGGTRARAPRRRWADLPLRYKGLVVVAITLFALVIDIASYYFLDLQKAVVEKEIQHSLKLRNEIWHTQSLLAEMATGVSAYLIGNNENLLERYRKSAAALDPRLDQLKELVRRRPAQKERMKRVEELIGRDRVLLAQLTTVPGAGDRGEPLGKLLVRSKAVSDALRGEYAQMGREEQAFLDVQEQRAASLKTLTSAAIAGSVVLGVGGGILAIVLFTSGIVKRVRRIEENSRRLAAGEGLLPLPPGRDEIGRLGSELESAAALLADREAQLKDAKEAAESASQAKSDFLSRMSHELRTPLNAILGFGQLLQADLEEPEERESVDQIVKAGKHLFDLINEILDIARIEAGRLTMSIEPVPIAHVAQDCVDLIYPLAANRNIVIDTELPDETLHVLADQQRLKQVLINFLSNAVKYGRQDGRIVMSAVPAGDETVRVAVADNGEGISPEKMEQLFTPFERLGAERSQIEGVGLGLALTKGLVEAMGGTIGVESVVGQGTTFFIVLPATTDFERAPEPVEVALSALPEAPAVSRTVLYVEDNLSNMKLVERIFSSREGIKLVPASQGQIGLDLARTLHPDLILLDFNLPDMNGDEVLSRLKGDPATYGIPVVMLTADASPGLRDRLLDAGAAAYAPKPIDVKEFLDVIDRVMAGGSAAPRPAPQSEEAVPVPGTAGNQPGS